MQTIIKELKNEHVGIGGLYFISTMVICAFILLTVVKLSWNSQAVAIADNVAYITSINVAVNGYVDRATVPAGNYTGALPYPTHQYSPLPEFNRMMTDLGVMKGQSTSCNVYFNGTQAVVQFGEFRTSLGSYVRPHQQESTIETD